MAFVDLRPKQGCGLGLEFFERSDAFTSAHPLLRQENKTGTWCQWEGPWSELLADASIQNNSGLPQGPSLGSEAG
jgi:hypothetical protein